MNIFDLILKWSAFALSILSVLFLSLAVCFIFLFPRGTTFSQIFQVSATGYLCAFLVIFVSYFGAPKRAYTVSVISFFVGSLVAWLVLKGIDYSETTYFLAAGEKSTIPLLTTLAGGVTCLGLAFFNHKWVKRHLTINKTTAHYVRSDTQKTRARL